MTEAAPPCSRDDCENPRHVKQNGIQMDKCTKHYLKVMSSLRD